MTRTPQHMICFRRDRVIGHGKIPAGAVRQDTASSSARSRRLSGAQIRRNWTLPRSCCRVRVRDGKDKSGNDERLPRGAHCGRLSASQKVPQITRPRRREERANRAVTRCRRRRLVTPDYSSVIAVRARVVVFNRRDASTRHACRLATAGAGGCRQSTPRTTVK